MSGAGPNVYVLARREAAGFTQAAFARAIGLGEKQFRDIEKGKYVGSLRHYVVMAKGLGCAVDDLVPDQLRLEPVPGARAAWCLPPRAPSRRRGREPT